MVEERYSRSPEGQESLLFCKESRTILISKNKLEDSCIKEDLDILAYVGFQQNGKSHIHFIWKAHRKSISDVSSVSVCHIAVCGFACVVTSRHGCLTRVDSHVCLPVTITGFYTIY